MKVTKVSASFEGVIPTGSYANLKISAHWEADLEAGDEPEKVQDELVSRIRKQLILSLTPLIEERVAALALELKAPVESLPSAIGRTYSLYEWVRTVAPELEFPIITDALNKVDVMRRAAQKASLKKTLDGKNGKGDEPAVKSTLPDPTQKPKTTPRVVVGPAKKEQSDAPQPH